MTAYPTHGFEDTLADRDPPASIDSPGLAIGDIEIPDSLPEPDGLRILVVSPRDDIRERLVEHLTHDGDSTWSIDAARDSATSRVRIATEEWAAVVIDTHVADYAAVLRTILQTPRHRTVALVAVADRPELLHAHDELGTQSIVAEGAIRSVAAAIRRELVRAEHSTDGPFEAGAEG